MEFLRSEYKKEWQFFKSEMKIIFPIMLVGFIALAVGTHFLFEWGFDYDPSLLGTVYELMMEAMSGINLTEDTVAISIVKLFFNNARVALMTISFGMIPFLCIPFVYYFSNGAVIGMVTAFTSTISNLGISFFMASLLPHGIFEIPAIVYACALGVYFCKENSKIILRRSNKRFGETAAQTLRSYVLVVLPLLIIAAIIEATLTMELAMRFV